MSAHAYRAGSNRVNKRSFLRIHGSLVAQVESGPNWTPMARRIGVKNPNQNDTALLALT